ncbi:MAG: ligase-associated damage response endonuclease PdeM [Novosphingobium sp.]|nr:ligase-associated damage response endonuclease PdeM [Novosphingobium sp.]
MVPLSFAPAFQFNGEELRLVDGRALFWPRENALLVADLHLEKASFFAKHGQMLPPYDSRETLGRIADALLQTGARRVFCLGDNFHDSAGKHRLEPHAAGMLAALTRATDWVWITGNHDAPIDSPGAGDVAGTHAEELEVAGMILRHRTKRGETRPELSGHYHPKLTIAARGRRVSRPCAVASESRLILPAFGALTGGMNAGDPAIVAAMQPARAIDALLPAAGRLVQYPLWRLDPLGMA